MVASRALSSILKSPEPPYFSEVVQAVASIRGQHGLNVPKDFTYHPVEEAEQHYVAMRALKNAVRSDDMLGALIEEARETYKEALRQHAPDRIGETSFNEFIGKVNQTIDAMLPPRISPERS